MNSSEEKGIKVLVVEDSRVIADLIVHVLESDIRIQVVGTASNGGEALKAVQRLKPDVITMDIHMPQMDGFEATRSIMESCPTPIVIVSSSLPHDQVATNFKALEAGALAVVTRPEGPGHIDHDRSTRQLVDTVRLMSEVKVVKRWLRPKQPEAPTSTGLLNMIAASGSPVHVVAIGASTGGPMALQTVFSRLPADLSVPVLVVQHMTPGFSEGFVEWLTKSSGFPIRIAVQGESLLPGQGYVAPDDFQMGISADHRIVLTRDERENGLRPSVSFLFRSVKSVYGRSAAGILLTGMGVDGVAELKELRDAGAVTIAQDEESSVIHGMPGQAIKIGAATHILPPESIAKAVATLVSKR
jgi:two-component system, chemotaxis family, protein-glutamate methylesterase/glutaminase